MNTGGSRSPKNDDLVSVIIPAYNAELTLDDTLRSVRSQTHTNLEIIIVDDGSTDQTVELANAQASVDNRIRVMSQVNAGVAAARNAGWHSAQSDFLAFVDADDLWESTKIEKQLTIMLAGGARIGLVYTWFAVINECNCIRFQGHNHHIFGDVLEHTLKTNFVGNGSSPLVRREALMEARGYESRLRDAGVQGCEDWLLYYRIAQKFHFGLVPEHLTGYRVASGRMSSDRLRMFRSFNMIAKEMKSDYPTRCKVVDEGARVYLHFLIGEAMASGDFHQVLPLIRELSYQHLIGSLWILAAVLLRKIVDVRFVALVFRRLINVENHPVFPICQPHPSHTK